MENAGHVTSNHSSKGNSTIFWVIGIVFLICLCGVVFLGAVISGLYSIENIYVPTKIASLYTATYDAFQTEESSYTFIDRFDNNDASWFSGNLGKSYLMGTAKIQNGIYAWTITYSNGSFAEGIKRTGSQVLTDFDMYVDAKLVEGDPARMCYGLEFRRTVINQDKQFYLFNVCQNHFFTTQFFDGTQNKWTVIQDWALSDAILGNAWNRLAVSAHGDHFVFTINGQKVSETTDDRLSDGAVGLVVMAYSGETGTIWFDNFAVR